MARGIIRASIAANGYSLIVLLASRILNETVYAA
jgi:hypothetical protein